jgi:glycosyltransferase involved in cell wall biosynthesis
VSWPNYALAASIEIAEVARALAPGTVVEPFTNGVETDVFRPVPGSMPKKEGERWAIVPRRLVEKNGVEDLIRAAPRVRARIPGARFLIVGDGPERSRLEVLGNALGVADAIRFLGPMPHTDMPGLIASAEIAIFPSRMEATSVAALEALACERPVVATRVGGLPEIVNEEVGVLVPPADPEALADGVVKLFEEGDLAAMGRRARERVISRWSNARLVDRHLDIYEDLVGGRPVRLAPPNEGT